MNKMIATTPITELKSIVMASRKRKFTDEQKLEILRQANEIGVIAVIRHHNLSYSVFSRWRELFMRHDKSNQGLHSGKNAKSEFKQIMEDTTRLKKIIADQALELARRDEQLRKNYQQHGKRLYV